MLVFGAGTDYALLLVARYREELRRHQDRHAAMSVAVRRSAPAIVASGSTVIAGMLCLLFASMNSTQGLGPVAAVGVAVALLVMLTLLPALLVIFGRWFFWPLRPSYGSADHTETSLWARVGRGIARGPRRTWVVTALLLAVASFGLVQLDADGLENKDAFYDTPDSVVGETVLARHFPAGSGQPVVVVATRDAAGAVRSAFAGTEGIESVAEPVVKGEVALLQGTLADAPDSQAAKDTVDRVREAVRDVEGGEARVGGGTAIVLDTLRASQADTYLIIPIVLVVVLTILILLLRAVVAPLVLIATVVLSFTAALGLSALLFRHVFGFAGADASLPLFVFVFLVALGHRLQHLPDDPRPRGGEGARHPARCAGRAGRDRRRDHVGGSGAGRHVRGAGHPAGRDVRRDRDRGGARGAARHDRGPGGAGDRAQPRHRAAHVVAEPDGAGGGAGLATP